MPELFTPAPMLGALEHASDLETAAVALFGADQYLMAGGTYGVVTRERLKMQLDEEGRGFYEANMPAIAVRVLDARADKVATCLWQITYDLGVQVAVDNADPMESRSLNSKIRERCLLLLAAVDGNSTFLASAEQVFCDGETTHGAVESDDDHPTLTISRSQLPMRVLVRREAD